MVDCDIAVAGDEYVVFNTMYDSTIDNLYSMYVLVEELFLDIFEKKIFYAFINDDTWNKYKSEYVKSLKAGNKYLVRDINFVSSVSKNNVEFQKNDSYVDKLVDIVGNDLIEFK